MLHRWISIWKNGKLVAISDIVVSVTDVFRSRLLAPAVEMHAVRVAMYEIIYVWDALSVIQGVKVQLETLVDLKDLCRSLSSQCHPVDISVRYDVNSTCNYFETNVNLFGQKRSTCCQADVGTKLKSLQLGTFTLTAATSIMQHDLQSIATARKD